MVEDHVEREEQLHLSVEEEHQQLRDVWLELYHDCSLLRFDHQYEDSFEMLNHWEVSINHQRKTHLRISLFFLLPSIQIHLVVPCQMVDKLDRFLQQYSIPLVHFLLLLELPKNNS